MKFYIYLLLAITFLFTLSFFLLDGNFKLDKEVNFNECVDEINFRPRPSNGLVTESQYPYTGRGNGLVTECAYPYTFRSF